MKRKGYYKDREGYLFWLLIIAAFFFLVLSIREYYPFLKNDIDMKELQEEVAPSMEIGEEKDQDQHNLPKWANRKINWKKLHKINPDIIAWIHVPGTKIDYPVLHCHKWNEYLHKDYQGKSSKPGSVFVQPETSAEFTDFHTVVFGHNMRNRSMFGSLHRFQEKNFWKKHENIYIYQPDKVIKALVYSAYDCSDQSSTYDTVFKDAGEKETWIQMTREKSYYPIKRKVNSDEHILTLSTCSNGGPKTSRYVVHSVVKEMIHFDE